MYFGLDLKTERKDLFSRNYCQPIISHKRSNMGLGREFVAFEAFCRRRAEEIGERQEGCDVLPDQA